MTDFLINYFIVHFAGLQKKQMICLIIYIMLTAIYKEKEQSTLPYFL